MKKFLLKHTGEIAYAVTVLICIFFFVHFVSVGVDYSAGITEKAVGRAEFYVTEQAATVEKAYDLMFTETEFFAAQIDRCEHDDELSEKLIDIRLTQVTFKPMIVEIFYVKGGEVYSWSGEKITAYAELKSLTSAKETQTSNIFQYDNRIMSIAVGAQISGSVADKLIVLYDYAVLSTDGAYGESGEFINGFEKAEFSLLVKNDGKIFSGVKAENSDLNVSKEPVQSGVIRDIFSSDDDRNKAIASLSGDSVSSIVFRKNTEEYVFTVYPFGLQKGGVSLISAFKTKNVFDDGYAVTQTIWSSLIGLAGIMVVLIASMIAGRYVAKKRVYNVEMINVDLNCSTPKKFEADVTEIMKRNGGSSFAIVSLKINNFGYFSERFGDDETKRLNKFTAASIRGALSVEETFAYAGEGEFLIFMHYRDRQSFTERINGIYLRISSLRVTDDYKVIVAFSVYEIEKERKQTVKTMLDNLKAAKQGATARAGLLNVSFYEDVQRENYFKKAEIESRMENALENSEFHLFYQPKFNLRTKTLDGSEILIRWFDPKIGKYRLPGEFLPVFEEDGFIVKIDRFVFFKACENIDSRIKNRQICFPVSVNVSRVTAISPDFVDYYVKIKKKFGIADGFITLEFTESFAYENYDFISSIVAKLHENGFLCSIDDFGTGYSSYNILKTIDMDEIKLDKFFLSKGVDENRDQTLLKSVIEMLKKLGMKVTQEGVETKEDLYRLEELGCDVIQGYYFSKPLKYVDYVAFIEENFIK